MVGTQLHTSQKWRHTKVPHNNALELNVSRAGLEAVDSPQSDPSAHTVMDIICYACQYEYRYNSTPRMLARNTYFYVSELGLTPRFHTT